VTPNDAAAIRVNLESVTLLVDPAVSLDLIQDDPDDNRVLECAAEGNADMIVSGDRHLLRLERFGEIPILRVREFLDMFSQRH
jgi:putative PIN family toxin of toxin-antitoxin system